MFMIEIEGALTTVTRLVLLRFVGAMWVTETLVVEKRNVSEARTHPGILGFYFVDTTLTDNRSPTYYLGERFNPSEAARLWNSTRDADSNAVLKSATDFPYGLVRFTLGACVVPSAPFEVLSPLYSEATFLPEPSDPSASDLSEASK